LCEMVDIRRKVPVLEPTEAIDEVLGEVRHGRDSSVVVDLGPGASGLVSAGFAPPGATSAPDCKRRILMGAPVRELGAASHWPMPPERRPTPAHFVLR